MFFLARQRYYFKRALSRGTKYKNINSLLKDKGEVKVKDILIKGVL